MDGFDAAQARHDAMEPRDRTPYVDYDRRFRQRRQPARPLPADVTQEDIDSATDRIGGRGSTL